MATAIELGASRVTLPPAKGLALSGYGGAERRAREDSSALEADILAFQCGNDTVVLVSLDVLFAGRAITRALRERFSRTQLYVFASHTHYAPSTDPLKPRLGAYEAGWVSEVIERISIAIERAMTGLVAWASASVGGATAAGSVNRRRRAIKPSLRDGKLVLWDTILAPHPAGPRCPELKVAWLKDAAGETVAALWTWCCHPTSLPDNQVGSSDYIGVVRQRLRQIGGDMDLPVLFVQGLAGDQRPVPGSARPATRTGLVGLKDWIRRSVIPGFDPMTAPEHEAWLAAIADAAELAGRQAVPTAVGPTIRAKSTTRPITDFLEGAPDYDLEMALIELAPELRLLALSAEPSVEFLPILEDVCPGAWHAGYLNDVFGYLPVDRHVAEGGYEVYGYMRYFSISGRYCDSMNAIVREMACELAGQNQ